MSYSFTDNEAGGMGRTMMVPFVDILNHSSYHHVELNFDPEALKLIAVRKIEKVCARDLDILRVILWCVRVKR